MIRTEIMKTKILVLTGTLFTALLVTFLVMWGPAQPPTVQAQTTTTGGQTAAADAAKTDTASSLAAGAILYVAQPTGSSMKIEGTSTLHDWKMTSSLVGGSMEADAKFEVACCHLCF